MSAHENCAVELAVRIAGDGGTVTVLPRARPTPSSSCAARSASAATAAVLIEADPVGYGPADVAREIAAVVKAHEAEGRTYDLILLGNDAADTGDFQVGIRLAYELGRPVVNGVRTVEVAGWRWRRRHRARRRHRRRRDLRGTAARRGDRAGGRRRAALPDDHRPDEGEEDPDRDGRAAAASRAAPDGCGSRLPPAQPSTVDVLGEGPDAAAAVVDLLQRLGVAR